MNILSIVAHHQTSEDYVYSDAIDHEINPEIEEIEFRFVIPALGEDISIDVGLLCSDDGIQWASMGEQLSFNYLSCPNGTYGILQRNINDGERFHKFGFNINGETVDVIVFGVVLG